MQNEPFNKELEKFKKEMRKGRFVEVEEYTSLPVYQKSR